MHSVSGVICMKMHVSELTPEEFQETFPNIKAKPVVDILLELDGTCNTDAVVDALNRT